METELYSKGFIHGKMDGYSAGYFTVVGKHPKRNKYKVDNKGVNQDNSDYRSGYKGGYAKGFEEGTNAGIRRKRLGKLGKLATLGALIYMGATTFFSFGKTKNNSTSSYAPNTPKNGVSLVDKALDQEQTIWDHPDKTRAEYYMENRLTTSQLFEDTLINQDLSPVPKKLSPITQIRQELSMAVGNGVNYDQTADAELYFQDKTNPDNVIAFGIGIMPSQVNPGCASLILTTMPSHKNGEARSMAGTKFNIQLGDYCVGVEVTEGPETNAVIIGSSSEDHPTYSVEQHNGMTVVNVNEQNQTTQLSEGEAEELRESYKGKVFHKGPGLYRTWENGEEPSIDQVQAPKNKENKVVDEKTSSHKKNLFKRGAGR